LNIKNRKQKSSEWTLDYPPFFAWFEKLLSCFASRVDPDMLRVDNLEYASRETILFQRVSVIASELILYWALMRYVKYFGNKWIVVGGSLLMHPGIMIIDHIHFQYNGILYGILLMSIIEAKRVSVLDQQ
jgi:alpha-1,3-glucosyltransferase